MFLRKSIYFFILINIFTFVKLNNSYASNFSYESFKCINLYERNIETFDFTPEEISKLNIAKNTLNTKYSAFDYTDISLEGIPKDLSDMYQIKIPEFKDWVTIAIYGRPYKVNGESYVDFKFWSKEGEKDKNFISDRESTFLRRMRLSDFKELGGFDNYVSYLQLHKFALVKVGDNKFRGMFFKKISDDNNTITLFSNDGNEVQYKTDELMEWNIGIKSSDFNLFKEIIKNNGEGIISFTSSKEGISKYEKEKSYFIISKIPSHFIEIFPNSDIRLLNRIYEILANNTPILITSEYNRINAAAANKFEELNIKKPSIIITPLIDNFYLTHELVHYNDYINELSKKFRNKYEELLDGNNKYIDTNLVLKYFNFINEQRAYSSQFKEMKIYKKDISKDKEYFIKFYINPIADEFLTLKLNDMESWLNLKRLAEMFCLESEDLQINLLFK